MYTINYNARASGESHMLQILVVVANIQTRTFKVDVRRVPCEQQFDMG